MSERPIKDVISTIVTLAVTSQNNDTLAKWLELNDIVVSIALAYRENMIIGLTKSGEAMLRDSISNLASALEITSDELIDLATRDDE